MRRAARSAGGVSLSSTPSLLSWVAASGLRCEPALIIVSATLGRPPSGGMYRPQIHTCPATTLRGQKPALPPGFIVPVTPESPPDVSPEPCAERVRDYLAWGDDLCGELRI